MTAKTRKYETIIFGITSRSSFNSAFLKYGKAAGVSEQILDNLLSTNSNISKLETGILTSTEFIKLFDKNCVDNSDKFSPETLLEKAAERNEDVNRQLLHAAKTLKASGLKIKAILSNWIEDRDDYKATNAKQLVELKSYFDEVVETSKVGVSKSDVAIFDFQMVDVNAKQTIVIDDDDAILNKVNSLGLGCKTIFARDIKQALCELEKEVGVKIGSAEDDVPLFPKPCRPDEVPHAAAEVRPGVTLHYVDVGTGPVVMLFHGFPEMWYAWRFQITALCAAGYRVIAMDQRGYGDSTHVEEIEAYSHKELCKDAIGLMDVLRIPTCIIIGHDWGGALVWALALKHPDRVRAVASINLPFICNEGLEEYEKNKHRFIYQIYFQKVGVAEKELEANLRKSFNYILQDFPYPDGFGNVIKRGSLMAGVPDNIRSPIISDFDVEYYIKQFTKSGFRGPLNYYRNLPVDAKWRGLTSERKITCPALMITTENDTILIPEFTKGMEKAIPNLTKVHLRECGHWALFEKPDKVSKELIEWLAKSVFNL